MNEDLHKLFLEELANIYDSEKRLAITLPKLARAAQSEELRAAFKLQLDETTVQVARLEKVFASLGHAAAGIPFTAVHGLIEESEETIQDNKSSSALDAALIFAAQKFKHCEIASYSGLCQWAEEMGLEEALAMLKETLREEKSAQIALSRMTANAAGAPAQ